MRIGEGETRVRGERSVEGRKGVQFFADTLGLQALIVFPQSVERTRGRFERGGLQLLNGRGRKGEILANLFGEFVDCFENILFAGGFGFQGSLTGIFPVELSLFL